MKPKFRAWHKDKKLMLDVIAINFELLQITADIENKKIYPDLDYWWKETDIPFSEVELMQSTGLKDKNGVEIYEGDVVKGYSVYPTASTFESFLVGEVYYTNRGTWDCYSYILGGFNEQVEVIGNIYENPLEKESK